VRLWVLVLTAFILEQMASQALFLALFVATFDSLLNNRVLCFSTSVNSVCSSEKLVVAWEEDNDTLLKDGISVLAILE